MPLDLVIPAHDEERRIGPMLRSYSQALPDPDTRFVVALDGCRDGTADVVDAEARRDPRIGFTEFVKLGKGGVLMETFRRCDADLIGFVDADGSTPPSEFARLVAVAQTTDGAIASRRHLASVTTGRRPISRRVTSAGFAAGIRGLFGLPYTDTQCGAKVLRRELLQSALPFLSSRDFLFDVDLLVVAQRLGYQISEVPTVWVDQAGSKVETVSDAGRMLASSLRLWLHHRVVPMPDRSGRGDVAA